MRTEALSAAAGLRGVGANVLDAEAREGPADMGEVLTIHEPAARGGCGEIHPHEPELATG